MKEKALVLIGLHSKKWLSKKVGINPLTLEKRLLENNWKSSEIMAIDFLYDSEKINL